MLVGQRVAAYVGRLRGVVDLEQAGHRLLLQPLAGVPLVHAGPRGDLADGERSALVQQRVDAELVADVHGEHVEGAEHGLEQVVCELVGLHGSSWDVVA